MNSQKGFSLLEILVAFSILAVSLTILLRIFSSGVNTAIVAEDYTIATQIAESLMAKTGVEEPLLAGEDSGVEDDKYRWRLNIENAEESEPQDDSALALMAVSVNVQWGDDENPRVVELRTLKPRPK